MKLPLADRHIVLVGLPGSGKSTVAPLLAEALRRPCLDIDAEIVRREGCSIAELFRERGEAGFREVETRVTGELLGGEPAVIAAGGGWVVTEANLRAASETAVTVHLRIRPATAAARLGRDSVQRPLLAAAAAENTLEMLEVQRRERYARADVEVDTELLDAEEVAAAVLALINRSGSG